MKIIKFRICNYKSIIDSGDCYLEEGVTILAGKNESGKSSILQALADFNTDISIDENVCPIQYDDLEPTIEIEFSLSAEDIATVLEEAMIDRINVSRIPKTVTITKDFNDEYQVHDLFFEKLDVAKDRGIFGEIHVARVNVFTNNIQTISKSLPSTIPTFTRSDLDSYAAGIKAYETTALASISSFPAAEQEILQTKLPILISLVDEAIQITPQPRQRLTKSLINVVPNFILFSSFDDIFPSEIPLPELHENKWILDLSKITDLNIETITGDNSRDKIKHKSKLNKSLNEDFSRFWTQDFSELEIEWDNTSLKFWIKEGEQYYEPEIRSQGRRWHLAFYIRVSARSREDVSNVILIDEPGLYLHATAQTDILNNLEDAGKSSQIIFTTHSPYLIEHDKLGRIRLVLKEMSNGTTIENKIHKVSDKETLTPILSAIGMGLNQGIANAEKMNNVIVEGMSDYYYFTAFKQLTNNAEINFIFGGGAGNMPKIGMILQGWGCNVLYLYDNDKAYQDAQKNIKQEWLILTKDQLLTLPVEGSVEDVFTHNDFFKHVLNASPGDQAIKNSERMKGKDKVLKAKKFCEQVSNGSKFSFDGETLNAIITLFENFRHHFGLDKKHTPSEKTTHH